MDIAYFSNKYIQRFITVENVQNVSLFTIAVSSFISYLTYKSSGNANGFNILFPIIGMHVFTDICFVKSIDVKLHHICVGCIFSYSNYYNVSIEERFAILYPLIKTEISSIFYILKFWIPPKSLAYNINAVLFYGTFLKFRIYDFYYEILYNNISFNALFQNYSPSNYLSQSIFMLSCYGLYILNLYWFLIMNKIIYKSIAKMVNIDTDSLCHLFCSHIHWVNIPLSIYIYAFNPSDKYIFDVVGITALSVFSYIYHYDVYYRLNNNIISEYIIPTTCNIVYFLSDNGFIHLRSFLALVTNYYDNDLFAFVIIYSAIFHITTILHAIANILDISVNYKDVDPIKFLNQHEIATIVPLVFDGMCIFANSLTQTRIPFLLVNISIGLLLWINPFYKLSHVAFHLLIIAQNYYICMSNSQTPQLLKY